MIRILIVIEGATLNPPYADAAHTSLQLIGTDVGQHRSLSSTCCLCFVSLENIAVAAYCSISQLGMRVGILKGLPLRRSVVHIAPAITPTR